MKTLAFEHRFYLNAFMKTAQYLAGLPRHDDIWRHLGDVMLNFYSADLVGFAERRLEGGVGLHHVRRAAGAPPGIECAGDILEAAGEVMETGFLTWRIVSLEGPHTIIFLPVPLGNEATAVMLVGHATTDPISNELLNVYLAVSGLAASTISKLRSEVELVQANEVLTDKTRIAQTLLDALPCIALLLRSDRVVVGSNKKAADQGMIPGSSCYEAWNAPDKPCAWCRVPEALHLGAIHREEIEVGRTCWETFWVLINPDLYLHYAFDITDRKQSEKELKAYAEKLEMLNQELQEFAFVASHDLKEPLRKIQTFGSLLEASCTSSLSEQHRDYLSRMTRSAHRMSALLDALLGYSRLATRPEPFVPADLSEIVREAVSDMELYIGAAEGRVDIGELPTMEVDQNQMRQLFQNLISNGVKYRKANERPLIRIYGKRGDGAYRLYVEDNGIGFDEGYLDRIFRPFQRLHGRNEYEGTGMGLAICRKIAERHGGAITAKSAPGEGAVFIVTLPLNRVQPQGPKTFPSRD